MSGKTAALIGATGMIGDYLLGLLLKDETFSTVRVIVRRPYPKPHPKAEIKLVDFDDAESVKLALEGTDVLFCCIGTTQKNVKGDKELYRKIDYGIPVRAARFAKEAGCETLAIVSSVGADSRSNTFYLKLKGEVEEAILGTGIRSVHIMQPSMLLGRRQENRPVEKLLQASMKFISGILAGSWRKYRAIHGKMVAAAMLNAAKQNKPGFFRYTYDGIKALAAPAR
ncbi:MAG: NAD(P)H-binding protein [Chitinophagaceae bacterium]